MNPKAASGCACVECIRCAACVLVLLASGCATRPPDIRIAQVDTETGYRIDTRLKRVVENDPETLLLVAFSGGGTRAAAFSYGVLEELRRTPVVIAGRRSRMLDQIDAISSVSGGSFTALAYALYGERLFEVFEPRFLKRNVEQGLIADVVDPFNWPSMMFGSFTRSDLAARYYDEILFDGATFGDLAGKPGPLVVASSTEFSSGYRFTFTQNTFDLICLNLSSTRLALAATASSAVPVAFAPVTLKNWGGTCGMRPPEWVEQLSRLDAAEALSLKQRLNRLLELEDSGAPAMAASGGRRSLRQPRVACNPGPDGSRPTAGAFHTLLDLRVRRVAVIVVNSQSSPTPGWDRSPAGPNVFDAILQAVQRADHNSSMDSIILMQLMIEPGSLPGREIAGEKARPGGRIDATANRFLSDRARLRRHSGFRRARVLPWSADLAGLAGGDDRSPARDRRHAAAGVAAAPRFLRAVQGPPSP